MENGEAIFIDEFNLSQMPEWFNTVLDEGIIYIPGRAEPIRAKKGFMVIFAGNQASVEGRNVISPALRSRFHEIWIDEITDVNELEQITTYRLKKGGMPNAESLAFSMVAKHLEFVQKYPKAKYGLRTLLQWADFLFTNSTLMSSDRNFSKGIMLVYGGHMSAKERH